MTQAVWQDDSEISLLALGTVFLRNRLRILRWMLAGAAVAAIFALSRPPTYLASASFVPQGNDASRSGLANLAGQLGVAIPATSQSLSAEFYAKLLKSRVLLLPIARDTFVVQEQNRKRLAFSDLFKIRPESQARGEEEAVTKLRQLVSVSVAKPTGVVELSVETKWRSVSLTIATALLQGVNDYNERLRQGQAGAERKFVEGRLAVAAAELRAAEDRLESFLRTNREFGSSPPLTFERDRLQRAVMLQQQVFTSLTQAYEDARIREVRDTPVIALFEPPSVSALPQARGRLKTLLLGIVLGGFIGALLVYLTVSMSRRRNDGDPDAAEFLGILHEMREKMFRHLPWLRQRVAR